MSAVERAHRRDKIRVNELFLPAGKRGGPAGLPLCDIGASVAGASAALARAHTDVWEKPEIAAKMLL